MKHHGPTSRPPPPPRRAHRTDLNRRLKCACAYIRIRTLVVEAHAFITCRSLALFVTSIGTSPAGMYRPSKVILRAFTRVLFGAECLSACYDVKWRYSRIEAVPRTKTARVLGMAASGCCRFQFPCNSQYRRLILEWTM